MRPFVQYSFKFIGKFLTATIQKAEFPAGISVNSYYCKDARSASSVVFARLVEDHGELILFVPDYGCEDIYRYMFHPKIEIRLYSELGSIQELSNVSDLMDGKKVVVLVVDLLRTNTDLVVLLKQKDVCVVYDRTHSVVSANNLSDYDIYSLGMTKRNGLGGGGLIITEETLVHQFWNTLNTVMMLFNLIKSKLFMQRNMYYWLKTLKLALTKRTLKELEIRNFKATKVKNFPSQFVDLLVRNYRTHTGSFERRVTLFENDLKKYGVDYELNINWIVTCRIERIESFGLQSSLKQYRLRMIPSDYLYLIDCGKSNRPHIRLRENTYFIVDGG